jgi:ectoine hydroxylase-related dioxygenase (phytanoyl-CoA dioxygenase family)
VTLTGGSWTQASAWDGVADRRAQFGLEGLCVLPRALDASETARARDAALGYYADVAHTIAQLQLEDRLASGGFATFKARDRGRFDMVVPAFLEAPHFAYLRGENAPWLALVRSLIGVDATLAHAGVIVALPDSAAQKWHSDGDHVHDELVLAAHAVNVFVPLVDVALANGATEFAPRTHLDWRADARPVVPELGAGDALVFDWRLKHRGLANRAGHARPLLYLTYAKPWFVDKYNFSRARYADLPPLVPRPTRDERMRR